MRLVLAYLSLTLSMATVSACRTTQAAPDVVLRLGSRPPSARVSIDGALVGRTPLQLRVTSGVHSIGFSLPGHRPETRTCRIHARTTVAHRQILLPDVPHPVWLAQSERVIVQPAPALSAVGCSPPIRHLDLAQSAAQRRAWDTLRPLYEEVVSSLVRQVLAEADRRKDQPDTWVLTKGYDRPFGDGAPDEALQIVASWRHPRVDVTCVLLRMDFDALVAGIEPNDYYGSAKNDLRRWLMSLLQSWASSAPSKRSPVE